MRNRLQGGVALLALIGGGAGATSLSDEFTAGVQQPSAQSPNSGFLADRLVGLIDLNRFWDLRGELMVTHDAASPPPPGSKFPSSGGDIFFVDMGADWYPNDHWSFGLELNGSPSERQSNDAPMQATFTNPKTGQSRLAQLDADLRSTNSSVGGMFNVGFDTAGERNWETFVNASAAVTRFTSAQSVAAVFNPTTDRTQALAALRSQCQTNPNASPQLCQAALGQLAHLVQARFALSVTETLFQGTDVGATGAVYVYDTNPTTVGFFSVAAAGRAQFGEGLPFAPPLYTVRGDVAQRIGGLRFGVWYQFLQYWPWPDQGQGNAVGVKVEYSFLKSWKVWLSGTGERDADAQGQVVESGFVSLGVRYKF